MKNSPFTDARQLVLWGSYGQITASFPVENTPDQFAYPSSFAKGLPEVLAVAQHVLEFTSVSSVSITYFLKQRWYKCKCGLTFPCSSADNMIYRRVVQHSAFTEIDDILNDSSFKFIVLKAGPPLVRYISATPVFTQTKIVHGAITLLDDKRMRASTEIIAFLHRQSEILSALLRAS